MQFHQPKHANRRGGFTLVELLVASAIATLLTGSTMLLLLQSAKEDRRAIASAVVERAASNLQDQILLYLRGMSASEGAACTAPVTDASVTSALYKTIVVARGPSPAFPREQISFDATRGAAVYYANRNQTNSAVVLMKSNTRVALRQLYFYYSYKPDGTEDHTLLNVVIKMDDNGSAGWMTQSLGHNTASVWRTFTVNMRAN